MSKEKMNIYFTFYVVKRVYRYRAPVIGLNDFFKWKLEPWFPWGCTRNTGTATVTVSRDHPPFLSLHHAHRGTRLYLVFPTSHRSLVCVAYNCCFRPKPTTQCCPFTGFCNWNIGLHKRPLSWRMQQVHWTKIWWRCCVTPAVEYHIVFKCERLTKKKLKYLKMARLSFN